VSGGDTREPVDDAALSGGETRQAANDIRQAAYDAREAAHDIRELAYDIRKAANDIGQPADDAFLLSYIEFLRSVSKVLLSLSYNNPSYMDNTEKFALYTTVLRFLVHKVSPNLWRIYMDIYPADQGIELTAFYREPPDELELELLDDIVTNSKAHIPHLYVKGLSKLKETYVSSEKHDFIVFAVHEREHE